MAGVESKHLDAPEETRTPEKTEVNVVQLGDAQVGRFTFEPGWKWSECVRPVAGTESCQLEHLGYVVRTPSHRARRRHRTRSTRPRHHARSVTTSERLLNAR
jgi:hypothetical protein